MGKILEKAKKKKKGRPSLLDLQKRTLREQQQQQNQQQQQLKPNPNPNPNPNLNPNSTRRSTRRNPNPIGISPAPDRIYREQDEEDDEDDDDDDDDDDRGGSSNGKRREKKLKLVLRLPPHQQNANASSLNSEDENGEEAPLKRRKINAVVGARSGFRDGEEGENDLNNATKTIDSVLGKALEPGPTTPLPDKKLLVFILDRIQKKDTYGVFSEPVDPNELPDYHDIIEHPMDFSTVRNKLSGGAYAFLEQFEKDVFLICSNAMKYNASDTIYFRQARTIQELAKKNFENLRQDSDDNEPEPKIVRRGRPPTKNLKKPIGRPPLDRASSEFSSDATLANGGDNPILSNSYDLRKSSLPEKSGPADLSGRIFNVSRNSEERKSERHDDVPATMSKSFSIKFGKKQFIFDENRRNTCKQFLASLGHEQSVLNIFDGQKKQLTAVGLHTEHGFARSLARFAADLGPIVWKIASKKIERALPAQTMFGPGWVGEKDLPLSRPSILTTSPTQSLIPQQHMSLPKTSSTSVPCTSDPKADKVAEKQEPSNNSTVEVHSNRTSPSTIVSSSSKVAAKSHEPNAGCLEAARDSNCETAFSVLKSSPSAVKPTPPPQIHPRPLLNSGMNGFHGSFGFNLASQMAKFARPGPPVGSFSPEISMHPQMLDLVSRSNNNFIRPIPANHLDSGYRKLPEGPSTVISDSAGEAKGSAGAGVQVQPQQSSLTGLSQHQKLDPVPPDLNVRFQSPGSPSCSQQQPDLALQL